MTEDKKLSKEQMNEVNERVKEIISTFRIALLNTSMYDHANYYKFGMMGDPEHVAFKKLFNAKREIVEYLEKETQLVTNNPEELYFHKRRNLKDELIENYMEALAPALRGRQEQSVWYRKAIDMSEKSIRKVEDFQQGIDIKGKMYSFGESGIHSPIIDIKKL